jgi:hypothetical protein
MARVIVLADAEELVTGPGGHLLLDERIAPVSLEDEHTSLQFIERVARAIQEADAAEIRSVA